MDCAVPKSWTWSIFWKPSMFLTQNEDFIPRVKHGYQVKWRIPVRSYTCITEKVQVLPFSPLLTPKKLQTAKNHAKVAPYIFIKMPKTIKFPPIPRIFYRPLLLQFLDEPQHIHCIQSHASFAQRNSKLLSNFQIQNLQHVLFDNFSFNLKVIEQKSSSFSIK